MRKKSVTIRGHRTSIALEEAFWTALEEAAARRGLTLARLVADIDAERVSEGPMTGLASALRVFALEEARRSVE